MLLFTSYKYFKNTKQSVGKDISHPKEEANGILDKNQIKGDHGGDGH